MMVPLLTKFAISKNLSVVPHPYTDADGQAWVVAMTEKRMRGEDYPFSIFRKSDGTYLGCCAAHPAREFEFGYWLGEAFWGRGIATEAARRVVRFAFDDLGAKQLLAGYMYGNPASGRVLDKVGFLHTHDETRFCSARGEQVLQHRVALTRERFEGVNVRS